MWAMWEIMVYTLPPTIMEMDSRLLEYYFPQQTGGCPLPCLFQGVYMSLELIGIHVFNLWVMSLCHCQVLCSQVTSVWLLEAFLQPSF